MSSKFSWSVAMALAVSAMALSSCGGSAQNAATQSASAPDQSVSATCGALTVTQGWYGDNRERLDAMIKEIGTCTGDGDVADGAPLALFDWDNTVVRNDIGDATTFWLLANSKVLQPSNWTQVSSFLTPAAVEDLTSSCGSLADPGQPLPTGSEAGTACADAILSVYSEGTTTRGEKAFEGFNARRIEPQYAFAAQLQAGYTDEEVAGFASQAREQNMAAKEGATQKIGSKDVTGWVRYYDQITDLIKTLKENGFDVRIISASAEPVARVWAEPLGLTDNKVMGVAMAHEGERITASLMPCGGDEASMPYIEGKRCRVNQDVLGITGPDAFKPAPESQRQAFSAGDSDTDVSFLIDATALRLVINRNKTELMCNAYDNEDGKWLINPMFIEPKGQKTDPYPCSTNGEILPDGGTGPLKDISGNLIEDQQDTVFGS